MNSRYTSLAAARRWVAEAAEAVLDAVFPPRCAGCDRLGAHFCAACAASVRPVRPPWCRSCGRSVVAGDICAECRLDPLPLAALRSAGAFDGPLRRAVHRLKYSGRRAAGRRLAGLLVAPARSLDGAWRLGDTGGADSGQRGRGSTAAGGSDARFVVPVPLHIDRERQRGYNQAALLATPLAAALGIPSRAALLRRIRPTASQVGLNARQRRENVRGAFAAHPDIRGRSVLLVDDVATTGSTLASAAQACLDAGATSVCAVTLAREL